MTISPTGSIMMISTHGYLCAKPKYGETDTGGQVAYVLGLSKCLARSGYNVDILTRRFENQPPIEIVMDRVRVLRFPCGGPDFIPKEILCDHIPEWVEHVAQFIESNRLQYRWIVSHYWDAGLAGQSLSRRFGIPHIHTPHSVGAWKRDNMRGDPEELERKYNFQRRISQEHTIYRTCDVIIASTSRQRDLLEGGPYYAPNGKVFVIPPGYDEHMFNSVSSVTQLALKQRLGLEGRIIFALGRIASNKGYDLLIRAMPVVFDRVRDARLLLAIGSNEANETERKQLRMLQRLASDLGVADRILFRERIPDNKLANYYRTANVFALSSRYEPFGMTAIEAMACGIPAVITTEGGLFHQLARDNCVLFANPFDSEEFGNALAEVLTCPNLSEQLATFGSNIARTHFTWSGITRKFVQVLVERGL
jgi:mannosylfructose-phosphate synthase